MILGLAYRLLQVTSDTPNQVVFSRPLYLGPTEDTGQVAHRTLHRASYLYTVLRGLVLARLSIVRDLGTPLWSAKGMQKKKRRLLCIKLKETVNMQPDMDCIKNRDHGGFEAV